jgi:hypothetical protein
LEENMGTVIASILPLAIGVALSPLTIVAVILMLFSKNARGTSLGFLLGWILGLSVASLAVVLLANPAQQATGGTASPLSVIVYLLLAVLFFFLAYRNWINRPKPGEQAEMPKWMSGIDAMTPGKAFGLGVALSSLKPKNLVLAMSAGVVIASAGLSSAQTITALVIFIVLGSITVAAPVIANLVLGDKAAPTLNSWKAWLIQNDAAVMMALFVVFGSVMLGKGLAPLIGG